MPVTQAIIIGGGIAGLAAGLALTRHNRITCSIFETRSKPATIGGAINLTPNALRYLEHLGVLPRLLPHGYEVKHIELLSHRSGQNLGKINFDSPKKFQHRALRVMRIDLIHAMLETLDELGAQVQYNKRIVAVLQENDKITAVFEDGQEIVGDILLGCDGIHSVIRTKFIEPTRRPEYTGIASIYGFLDVADIQEDIPIETTTLYTGRFGSLLLSY